MKPVATIKVRDAEAAEAEALAKLWHGARHEAHASIVPPALTRLRTLQNFTTRLREALDHLFVASHARGSGAAAALLVDAEARPSVQIVR